MILLLYAAILMKKQWWNRWNGLAGYLICLLAILWNTETGVILAVAWMALYISRCLAGGEWRIGRLARTGTRGLCDGIIFRSLWTRESL